MAEERALRIVDAETGELQEHCPNCAAMADQLAGAENNVRSMRAQMANLKRELAGELDEEAKEFPAAVALFRYWQERCNHPRATFTADRMKALLPLMKRHGPAACREAIRGAAYDPFISTRKNGTKKRHDDFCLIFAGEDKLQSFRERAPEYDGKNHFQHLDAIAHAREVFARVLERKGLMSGKNDVAIAHLLIEIHAMTERWRRGVWE